MTIFLRPGAESKPVGYLKSIERAALIVNPQMALAMYTTRSTPNVGATGPAGPAGTDQNSLFDTIIASCSDEVTPIDVDVVTPKTTFRAPYALDLATGYVRASLTTAPTGSQMTITMTMNGAQLFSTHLTIDATEKTSVTASIPAVLDITDIPDDAEFKVFVAAVGSTIAGMDLKVAVTGIKVEP